MNIFFLPCPKRALRLPYLRRRAPFPSWPVAALSQPARPGPSLPVAGPPSRSVPAPLPPVVGPSLPVVGPFATRRGLCPAAALSRPLPCCRPSRGPAFAGRHGLCPAAALSRPCPTTTPVTALPCYRPCRGPVFTALRSLCPTAAPVTALPCCRPGPSPDLNSQLRPCPAPAPAEPRRPTEQFRPAEPRCSAKPRCPSACTASAAPSVTAATVATTATAATAATAAMASPTVLTFDAEGRAVDFDVWVDDLQLFLQCDSRDGVSLFDHTSGVSIAPAATADSMVRSQWTTRDAVARLAVCSQLPPAARTHFGQYKTAQSLYDAVVARYSSPATAALSRLMLPYLFPDLAAFAIVLTSLLTSALVTPATAVPFPLSFAPRTPPPMYITLYYLVTRLPDSLASVRDHFLSLCPTKLTVDLLEERLAAAEKSILAVGASRGDRRTPFFEGCSPVPLLPSLASAAAVDLVGTKVSFTRD
ncbi:unnamed protein product [Closterium sp. NIES-54]